MATSTYKLTTSRGEADSSSSDEILTKEEREDREKYKQRLSDKLKDYKKALGLRKHPVKVEIDIRDFASATDPEANSLAYVNANDRGTIYFPKEPSFIYGTTGLPEKYNEVIAHELMHTKGEDHSKDKSDLMYDTLQHPITKESLAEKIKKYAIKNLEEEEAAIKKELEAEGPVLNPPIPVKEMYERIEKNQPKDKKHRWWSKRVAGKE